MAEAVFAVFQQIDEFLTCTRPILAVFDEGLYAPSTAYAGERIRKPLKRLELDEQIIGKQRLATAVLADEPRAINSERLIFKMGDRTIFLSGFRPQNIPCHVYCTPSCPLPIRRLTLSFIL